MNRIHQALALTATAALTLTLTTPVPAYADERTDLGADWLTGELVGGLMPTPFGGSDYGLSIDAGLSLNTVGKHAADVSDIADAVSAGMEEFVYFDSTPGGAPEYEFAGQMAKAAVFAQAIGDNPEVFGDVALITKLKALTVDSGPLAGRIQDKVPTGEADSANVFGQSFAARALRVAGAPEAQAAADFLLKQQCAAGFFRLNFAAANAAEQACTGEAIANPDATAIAIINLTAAGDTRPTVLAAVDRAADWLRARQLPSGAIAGDQFTPDPNSNTTGLVAIALGLTGDCVAPAKAAHWVGELQVPNTATGALVADKGAIAYTPDALAAAQTEGVTDQSRDQFRRTTAQALPALDYRLSPGAGVRLVTPQQYVRAGSRQSLRVGSLSGRACLGLPNGAIVSVNRSTNFTVPMPGKTTNQPVALLLDDKRLISYFKVLGALKIPASLAKARVQRGAFATVKVRKLAANEKVKITWRGRVVATGRTSKNGTLVRSFPVGNKVGKAKVLVTGQFADLRRRSLTLKVTR